MILGFIPSVIPAAEKSVPPGKAMPVRYSEGVVHGYVVLTTLKGEAVAHGELLQTAHDGEAKGRMVFRFKDGSISDETTEFTQRGVFTLKSYHQIQRGPAFPKDVDYKIDRISSTEGRYQVTTKEHKDGKIYQDAGRFEMPADLYNGLVIAVAKNLPAGGGRTIHLLALTPKPRLVRVDIRPAGKLNIMHGGVAEQAMHYVLHPDLGFWLGTLAKVVGKSPPDQHLWMATQEAPGFAKFEGPMFSDGPVWRISLGVPCFATRQEPCRDTR